MKRREKILTILDVQQLIFFVLESGKTGGLIYDASCEWEGYEKIKLAIQLPESRSNKKTKNISRRKYKGKVFEDDYKLHI